MGYWEQGEGGLVGVGTGSMGEAWWGILGGRVGSAGSMERQDWAAVEGQCRRKWWHLSTGKAGLGARAQGALGVLGEPSPHRQTTAPSMPRAPRSAPSAVPRVCSLIGCSVAALPPAAVIGGCGSGATNGAKGAGPARPGGAKCGAGADLAREGWWRQAGGPGRDLRGLGGTWGTEMGGSAVGTGTRTRWAGDGWDPRGWRSFSPSRGPAL